MGVWIKEDLKLQDREWTCSNCNRVLDSGLNAAKNILSAGTVDYTGGDSNQTSFEKRRSVKPEAQPIGSAVGG